MELENTAQFMTGEIEDAFVAPALKFDFIYQYNTTTDWKYLAQIPSFRQPAYNLKRVWLGVANGFLPEWHHSFIPTKIGNTVVSAVNRKIFSGQMLFEAEDSATDKMVKNKHDWFVNTYLDEINPNYERELQRLNWFSMASGASLLVGRVNANGNLTFEALREDKYLPTFSGGELMSVRMYRGVYATTDSKQTASGEYVLEDYRYKKQGQAFSILRVFEKSNGDLNSIVDTNPSGLTYEDMPEEVARAVWAKCGNRLNKATRLPFKGGKDLGVRLLEQGGHSAYFDMPGYHDSILAPALEMLFEYDRSYTTMVNDIAMGRGQVLVPDGMNYDLVAKQGDPMLAALISQQNMLNTKQVRKIPSANPENQKPEIVQFDMRVEQHLSSLKGQRACIFNAIGINPGAIDPTIDESGHAKTATEVIADEQNLVTFVADKRKPIVKVSDWAISLVLEHYFKDLANCGQLIHTKFTNGDLSNRLLVSQMNVAEVAAGIRSKESAVKNINPSANKTEIDNEMQALNEQGGNAPFVDDESAWDKQFGV